jgi:hypothetical protein
MVREITELLIGFISNPALAGSDEAVDPAPETAPPRKTRTVL